MDDRTLADRLVSYADALVAISFVGMSGLSIALADPDVRSARLHAARFVVVWFSVNAAVLTPVAASSDPGCLG